MLSVCGGTSISRILNTTLVFNNFMGTCNYRSWKSTFIYLKSFLWSYSSGRAILNEDNVVFSSGSGKTACPHAVKSNGTQIITSKMSKLILGKHFKLAEKFNIITFGFRFYSISYHLCLLQGLKVFLFLFLSFFFNCPWLDHY